MFGRRRHVAVVPAAPLPVPVPRLTDEQILELVHGKISELIGVNGEWTVSRRSADDTDAFFHSVLAQSVSVGIAAAITDARRRLEEGDAPAQPQHLAGRDSDTAKVPVPDDVSASEPEPVVALTGAAEATDPPRATDDEPIAFSWEPAPITVWTDLRRPVTAPVHTIPERSAA